MGMTPLEGLVMGTRAGDVDPGVLLHLLRSGYSVDALDDLLNRRSGLVGLSGVGNDMRDIERRAEEGDERCRRALQVFTHRVRKYVGAYAAVMGGVDAIAFTGGIGEHSALIRNRVLQRLDFLGARLDDDLNGDARVDASRPVARISTDTGVALLVVKALVVTATFAVVLRTMRARGVDPVLGCAMALLAAWAGRDFWDVRPQIWTYLLVAVYLWVLREGWERRRGPFLWLPLLMVR